MRWSEQAWERSRSIYKAIVRHPFLRELADGSLSRERFERYLAQDEIYLSHYADAMKAFAAMIPSGEQRVVFEKFATDAMNAERDMHQMLCAEGLANKTVIESVVSRHYCSHTRESLARGKEFALAAILPCDWVYCEVGLLLHSSAELEGNPYRQWIEEYVSPEFVSGVRMMIDLADSWADSVPQLWDDLCECFAKAVLYEYAFWDYAYHGDEKSYDYIVLTDLNL